MNDKPILCKTYKIDQDIRSLAFLTPIVKEFDTYLCEDLEIEPFHKFTTEFQVHYWYLQYHLLKDKKVDIDDSLRYFFEEEDLNIIWFQLTDGETFKIKCLDGAWFIEILKANISFNNIASRLNLKEIT